MKDYYCEKHNGPRQSLSDSLLSLNNLPNTSVTTPSDKSSNESLNFKSRDSMEMIFPISSSHIGIKDNDTISEVSKNNEKSLLSKSTNRSLNIRNGISNPKSVFRENSLIFGDMTLESLTDSQASSPHSLDSPVERVQQNIVNNNEIKSNDTKHTNGDNQNWISNSVDSGNVKDSSIDLVKINVNNNNIKNTSMNQNVTLNEKELEKLTNGEKEKLHLNNSNSSSGSNVSEKKFTSNYKHSDTKYAFYNNIQSVMFFF